MPGETLEIVQRSVDALNRSDLEGWLDDWAPDAVLDWSNAHGPDAGVYRGHNEIQGFVKRFREAFEDVQLELGDPIEIDEGTLVVENVAHVRGRGGIETQARSAWVITFRDGAQTSLTLYQTMEEALAAVGRSR